MDHVFHSHAINGIDDTLDYRAVSAHILADRAIRL